MDDSSKRPRKTGRSTKRTKQGDPVTEEESYYDDEEEEYEEEEDSNAGNPFGKDQPKPKPGVKQNNLVPNDKKEKQFAPHPAPGIQPGAPSKLDIPEKFLDDISDGDYLLESLRDFRPPTAEHRTEAVSFFEGKGKLPEKLQIIGGAAGVRG